MSYCGYNLNKRNHMIEKSFLLAHRLPLGHWCSKVPWLMPKIKVIILIMSYGKPLKPLSGKGAIKTYLSFSWGFSYTIQPPASHE